MAEEKSSRPRVIVDVNKHGIRRERNIDFVKKKFKKARIPLTVCDHPHSNF